MIINKLITETLKPCGLPAHFASRGDNPTPCVVFNVGESPGGFCDNEEDVTEYDIILNVYISSDRFVETVGEIKRLMKVAGFTKRNIPPARWDDTLEVFNQPMEYRIYK